MNKSFYRFTTFLLMLALIITSYSAAEDQEEITQIVCKLKPIRRHKSKGVGRRRSMHQTFPHIPLEESTSLNWSGYASATSLTHPTNHSVTDVSGRWKVPKLSSSLGKTYCSIWVGIDGYSDNTVEQIGTEHDWTRGFQKNYAWFEMYPYGAYEIVGFPVHINDIIGAEVHYSGNNLFTLTITNYTQHVSQVIPSYYTRSSSALRTSAEWIVEAPSMMTVLPLAHFGTINFTNCSATINGVTGSISHTPNWVYDPLTMVTQLRVIKSLPSSLSPDGHSFSVTWKHE